MNYSLIQAARLLCPTDLQFYVFPAATVFTSYFPASKFTPSTSSITPTSPNLDDKALLVLTSPPHTKVLVSQSSLTKYFTHV